MNQALKNGYSIVRILQEDVWYDRNNWLEKLIKCIEYKKIHKEPEIIYICSRNEYDAYKNYYIKRDEIKNNPVKLIFDNKVKIFSSCLQLANESKSTEEYIIDCIIYNSIIDGYKVESISNKQYLFMKTIIITMQ